MKLTQSAQQSFDFSLSCYYQGFCTEVELSDALKKIVTDDLNKQSYFLIEKGFSPVGEFNHIHNCDIGSEVL